MNRELEEIARKNQYGGSYARGSPARRRSPTCEVCAGGGSESWCVYCGRSVPLSRRYPPHCSSCSPHRRAVHSLANGGLAKGYEAEDVSRYRNPGSNARGRSGLYYSPPGTSYTIVERPVPLREIGFRPIRHDEANATSRQYAELPPASSSTTHHSYKTPRGTYLGSSGSGPASARHGRHQKKEPISPEQVIQLLGSGKDTRRTAKSPLRSPPSRSHVSPHRDDPPLHPDQREVGVQSPPLPETTVRTVHMVRPPDSSHGFGICVKGGKDTGK